MYGGRLTKIVYYFFSDVFPPMHDGYKPLDPPSFWVRLFDRRNDTQAAEQIEPTEEEVQLNRGDLAPAPEVRG